MAIRKPSVQKINYLRMLATLEHADEVRFLWGEASKAKALGNTFESDRFEQALEKELADLTVILMSEVKANPRFAAICEERQAKFVDIPVENVVTAEKTEKPPRKLTRMEYIRLNPWASVLRGDATREEAFGPEIPAGCPEGCCPKCGGRMERMWDDTLVCDTCDYEEAP